MRGFFAKIALVAALLPFGSVACAPPTVGIGPAFVQVTFHEKRTCPIKYEPVDLPQKEVPQPAANSQSTPPIPAPVPKEGESDPGSVVTTLHKGDPAPYSGTLFSPEAVANVIAQIESTQSKIDAEVKKATSEQKAEYELKLKQEQNALAEEQAKRAAQVKNRDDQIKELNKQLSKDKNPPVVLWVGGGAAAGALATLLGVILYNKLK